MILSKGDWVQIPSLNGSKAEIKEIVNVKGTVYYRLNGFIGLYKVKKIEVEQEGNI